MKAGLASVNVVEGDVGIAVKKTPRRGLSYDFDLLGAM
jgi:hypothetical protein